MAHDHHCPSCGRKLAPSDPRVEGQHCPQCKLVNPAGFKFCGYCSAALQPDAADAGPIVADTPPRGWADISDELAEVRFFVDQGLEDDAADLIGNLRRRHKGHPDLEPLVKTRVAPDTGVLAVVDEVLASSPLLRGPALRRGAPRWEAPTVRGPARTAAHTAIAARDDRTPPRGETVVTRVRHKAKPWTPPKGSTVVVDSLQKAKPWQPPHGSTQVVDSLQAPAPFSGEIPMETIGDLATPYETTPEPSSPSRRRRRAKPGKAAKPSKPSKPSKEDAKTKAARRRKAAYKARAKEVAGSEAGMRKDAFGQNVLGRLNKRRADASAS